MYTQIINFFCVLSGEDLYIIKKCNSRIQFRFAFIGLVSFLLLICTFSGIFFYSYKIFNDIGLISLTIATIWTILFTSIYLLMLYTFSPNLLPTRKKRKKDRKNYHFSISIIVRIFFIILLALFIIQPLNYLIYSSKNISQIQFSDEMRILVEKNIGAKLINFCGCLIFLIPVYLKYNIRNIQQKKYKNEFEKTQYINLNSIHIKIENWGQDYTQLVSEILNFDLNELKASNYYLLKKVIDMRIILEEYAEFKIKYQERLNNKSTELKDEMFKYKLSEFSFDSDKEKEIRSLLEREFRKNGFVFYENYIDSPFNTIKKPFITNEIKEESILLDKYYLNLLT